MPIIGATNNSICGANRGSADAKNSQLLRVVAILDPHMEQNPLVNWVMTMEAAAMICPCHCTAAVAAATAVTVTNAATPPPLPVISGTAATTAKIFQPAGLLVAQAKDRKQSDTMVKSVGSEKSILDNIFLFQIKFYLTEKLGGNCYLQIFCLSESARHNKIAENEQKNQKTPSKTSASTGKNLSAQQNHSLPTCFLATSSTGVTRTSHPTTMALLTDPICNKLYKRLCGKILDKDGNYRVILLEKQRWDTYREWFPKEKILNKWNILCPELSLDWDSLVKLIVV